MTPVLYIATQDPAEMGIALARFDSETGVLSPPRLAAPTRDPAFITLHPDGFLYVCNTGTPGGVSSFAIERSSGALTFLNHRPAVGRGPSHIALDRTGRFVLDANYGGGYVEIHERLADGSLGRQTAFVQHSGSSVHPQRQTKPYAHWFGVDPSNRFALAADLGTDRIVIYRFDATTGALAAHEPPHASVRAGSGPRHIAWHPNGRFVYAIQELSNEIIAYEWDSARGALTELQIVATLPPAFDGTNTAAEIAVHGSGQFLYASNRGHDSIAVFALDTASGRLTLRQHVGSKGATPRHFALDPTQRWLIVSNQEGNNLVVFRIDERSGTLAAHGEPVSLKKPMSLVFLPAGAPAR